MSLRSVQRFKFQISNFDAKRLTPRYSLLATSARWPNVAALGTAFSTPSALPTGSVCPRSGRGALRL